MKALAPRPFTGRHMLAIMLGFFTVVFAANMTMVYFAKASWTGLVVRNSYVASQEFNEKEAEMAKASEIAVHISWKDQRVTVVLSNASDEAVAADKVVLNVGRPTHEGEDQTIPLSLETKGTYAATLDLESGQWSGTVTADIAGWNNWSRPIYLLVKG